MTFTDLYNALAVLIDLVHEHIDVRNVSDLDLVSLYIYFHDFKVILQRVANNGFASDDLLKNRSNVLKTRSIVEIALLDASNPLSVINDSVGLPMIVARLNQSVKHDISIVIDDADPG
jgi:hypothetical protein